MVLAALLLTSAQDAPVAVAIAALTLALALLVRLRASQAALAAGALATVRPTGDQARPVLRGRVTDPVHHPLRPRAPGRV
jgi:hypothetical protein